MKRIYLDHHSTTKPDEQVVAQMLPYLTDKWGSYVQPHDEGQKLIPDIIGAYEKIKDLVKVTDEATVVFTSSNVEAINHVLDHVYRKVVRESGKNHLIALSSDVAPILMPLKRLEPLGCHTTYLPAGQSGSISIQEIEDAITPRTALITLSIANGMTGVIQNIEGLKEICALRGILLHLEVSYVLGKIEIDFQELGADFITFGGDLLQGPKSSGALVVKDSLKLEPFIVGGQEQNGLRGGTLDLASLIGFATACSLMKSSLSEMNLEVARLRNQFEKKIVKELDQVQVLFQTHARLPNVAVIAFEQVHADCLLYTLNKRGVAASIGGGVSQKLSLLLENMGYPSSVANTAISFSFSKETTLEEMQVVIGILVEEVKRLRLMTQKLELAYES